MEIIELDIRDTEQLRVFWEVEQAAHRYDRARPLLRTFDSVASTYADPTPHYRREPLAAVVDDRVVGIADLGFSVGDNEHLADLEICVHPDHRRRGVGQALHAEATRRRRAAGRTSDTGEVYSPVEGPDSAGLAFARALDYADVHGEHHLVMDLPVDEEHVAALAATGHPDHEIVTWVNRCPDDLIDAYVEMRNRMNSDVPTGELDRTPPTLDSDRIRLSEERLSRSYDSVVAAARRTSDGTFGGYSLIFVPHGTGEVLQDDTLVMPDHRGHRLGIALKLATLEIVRRDHADRSSLHTSTAPDNHAMYGTNQRFGYRAVEVMHEMQRTD